MDPTVEQWRFKVGDEVVSGDGHSLGKVCKVEPEGPAPTHLIVEKGKLFRQDYRIPVETVSTYEGGTIYLALTRDEAVATG